MKSCLNTCLILALWMLGNMLASISAQDSIPFHQKLSYNLQSHSFFSNKEYNSEILEGFTLTGSWLKTGLNYHISDHVTLTGTLFYHRFFGNSSQKQEQPFLFNIEYRPNNNFSVTIGDIFRVDNRHMSDFLYNPDLLLSDPVEEGLSIKYSKNELQFETWLDWERFILKNSPFREEFTVGAFSKLPIWVTSDNRTTLRLNIMFKHKGGEIDASPLTVQTLFNSRVGFNQKFLFKNKNSHFGFGLDMLSFMNNSSIPEVPIEKGMGINVYTEAKFQHIHLNLSYWYSDKYYSPKGDPYFNNYYNGRLLPNRQIAKFSAKWRKKIMHDTYINVFNHLLFDFSAKKADFHSGISMTVDLKNQFF